MLHKRSVDNSSYPNNSPSNQVYVSSASFLHLQVRFVTKKPYLHCVGVPWTLKDRVDKSPVSRSPPKANPSIDPIDDPL